MADDRALVPTGQPDQDLADRTSDDRALVPTGQPDQDLADRTSAVANPPAKEADVESSALPGKSGAEPRNKKRLKKVLCCWCCFLILGILLLLAIILIILIFTLFKVKDPTIKVTDITLASISISAPITIFPITLNAVADANVSVHNPNVAGLNYGNSTVYIFYRGEQVAQAPIPAGHIKAHGNEHLFLPVQVALSSNDINANITGNLTNDLFTTRTLPLVSVVDIRGTVKVTFVKIKNVRTSATCNINYFLANGTESFDCQYKTKI